jgi:hypothetical protein
MNFRLMAKARSDSCTTGKSTIGDEKTWNVFMRLDTPQAKRVLRVCRSSEADVGVGKPLASRTL